MEDLSTKPFEFQQKVADCRVLYLAFGGRHHEHIEREMRGLGHATFYRRVLYARRDRGRFTPGWPKRFGWNREGESSCEGGTEKGREGVKKISPSPSPSRSHALSPTSFKDWLKRVSPEFQWDWKYQQYVYRKLKRVTDGLCKRLMIFMPPRHGKSELVTQRYAAWRLKREPKMRVVVASYNQKLANRFSRGIKRILNHDAVLSREAATEYSPTCSGAERGVSGHQVSPEPAERATSFLIHDAASCPACIEKAQRCPNAGYTASGAGGTPAVPAFRRVNTESEWETREGGGVRAVGVGAGITGFGADLVIIDDPVKGHAQAESATMRENVWEWFNSDIYTRLEPEGAIILIQTRWHSDDLAGRLLREMKEDEDAEQWEVIDIPALSESSPPPGSAGLFAEKLCFSEGDQKKNGGYASGGRHSREDPENAGTVKPSFTANRAAEPQERDCLGRILGEALCPERFDEKKLETIKKKLGTYAFSALKAVFSNGIGSKPSITRRTASSGNVAMILASAQNRTRILPQPPALASITTEICISTAFCVKGWNIPSKNARSCDL